MKAPQMEARLNGRSLDPAAAEEFSKRASSILGGWPTPADPPPEQHFRALMEIAKRSEALAKAFYRVQAAGKSAQFLREAWHQAWGRQAKPFPDDLVETLRCLAAAATIWQPDPKPAGRPVSPIATFAVKWLVANYRDIFGKLPTIGTNTPFVRYCREALPKVGLECPSLGKMTAIVAELNR